VVQTVSRPLTRAYSEQLGNTEVPANNGTRLPIAVRRGFTEILVEPAAACRMHMVPGIAALYFYDASRNPKARWIDLLGDKDKAIINRHVAGDSGKALNAMTTADAIYMGMKRVGKGWHIDMDASLVNAVNPTTMTGAYSQGNAFTATAITDGTDTGAGATLAQDGNVTIDTVPTTWTTAKLSAILGKNDAPPGDPQLFWFRLTVSATLTNGVEIEKIIPMAAVGAGTITTDSDSLTEKAATEYSVPIAIPEWVGALEFIAQAAAATTANLTWLAR